MGKTILLVEDEADLREILALVIETEVEGVKTVEVSSGNEAIKYLADNPVDLIISDYTMFDGTGGDLYLDLLEKKNTIPFILLTGGFIEDYPEFKDCANHDFYKGVHYKPFDSDDLAKVIEELLYSEEQPGLSADSEDVNYFEFPLEIFEKISYLHIDTYTKIGESKYVKFMSATDSKPIEQFIHFKQKGLKSVYIQKNDLSKYLLKAQEYLVDKFSEKAKVMEKIEFGDFIFEFSKVALDFIGVTEQVYGVVNEQVNKITSDVKKSKDLSKMLKASASSESYLSSHCIMTAYLCVHISSKMNLTEAANTKKLIVSSLFHDISMTDQRLAKMQVLKDSLSSNDKKILMNHMKLSCEFIEKIVNVGEEDIFTIIKGHHERPDGSGFPQGLTAAKIPVLNAIFIIAHELVTYLYASNFNMRGMKEALTKFPKEFSEGNFKKPYTKLMEALDENEHN